MFEVTYNPNTGTSTWVARSYDMGDIPVTDLVRGDATGDLYAANDFGVLLLRAGTTTWVEAASGMPNVEVAGLTILPEQADPLRRHARSRCLAPQLRLAT